MPRVKASDWSVVTMLASDWLLHGCHFFPDEDLKTHCPDLRRSPAFEASEGNINKTRTYLLTMTHYPPQYWPLIGQIGPILASHWPIIIPRH